MCDYPMLEWAKDLFPICRSLTGEGTRKTLSYFETLNPELKREIFRTGEQVFDWEVPKEWKINDAYIQHESGRKFAEYSKNNLHILNYSTSIDIELPKEELLSYVYTQPDQPDWIPYVASYYEERWGFCMSEKEKLSLPDGNYRAYVDSALFEGELHLSHALLKGRSKREIFFSSYICHPSMANNELSGPVLLSAIMLYIKDHYPDRHYSYRFVLLPETIGSIAYMSRYLKPMKENIISGFNLSCVGDERAYSRTQSRLENTLADSALGAALIGLDNVKTYSFLNRGSDERQYCAPNIDLPVCVFSRSRYGAYPEYHTSADNFDVVTQKGLGDSFKVIKNVIDAFEIGIYPKTNVLGEPQLSKRNLRPTISQKTRYSSALRTRMDFLAYADGQTNLFDLACKTDHSLESILKEYKTLMENGIVGSGFNS